MAYWKLKINIKQRCVICKGRQKDANNIKTCLKVLKEYGENFPHLCRTSWTCCHLSFDNVDVSNFLCKIERLHSEMSAVMHAVKLQWDIGEDLHVATATIDSKVSNVERWLESHREGHGLDSLIKKYLRWRNGKCPHSGKCYGAESTMGGTGSSTIDEPVGVTWMATEALQNHQNGALWWNMADACGWPNSSDQSARW